MAKEKEQPAVVAQTVMLPIGKIETNHGQVEGLPKNPRILRDEQFKKLKKSIEDNPEMLILRELLVYPHGGKYVVIGGNMRLRVLQDLGEKEVPCKIIAEDTPVDKLRAYTIKDNTSGGEWDWDDLANEWDAAELDDWGLETPDGWGEEEQEETSAQEDDFDETKDDVPTICQRGDIWQLGDHRLMCGDSTDATDVTLLMDGAKADGVLTDPPFGNDLGYGRGQLGKRYIANDNDTKVLSSFFAPLDSVLKNNTHCLVWIQWRSFSTLERAFEKYKLRTVVIWDKMQPGLSGGGFAEQYEMMCVFIKGHATQNEYCGNVWQISREHDKRSESEHPHKKPIALLGKALNLCSKEGDIILDLFGGSGSTLIAAEQLHRKCYMMELDEHYCDVIIARWEKLTGGKATKITNINQPTE